MAVVVSSTNPVWCVTRLFYNAAYEYIDCDSVANQKNAKFELTFMFGESPPQDGNDVKGNPFRTIFESEIGVYCIPTHLFLAIGNYSFFKIGMEHAFPRKVGLKEEKVEKIVKEKVIHGKDIVLSATFIELAKAAVATLSRTHYDQHVLGMVREYSRMFPIEQHKNPIIGNGFKCTVEFRDSMVSAGLFITQLEQQFPEHFKPSADEIKRRQKYDWPTTSVIYVYKDTDIIKAENCRITKTLYDHMCKYAKSNKTIDRVNMMDSFDGLFPKFQSFNYDDAVWPGVNYETGTEIGTETDRFIIPRFVGANLTSAADVGKSLDILFPSRWRETMICANTNIMKAYNCCITRTLYDAMCKYADDKTDISKAEMDAEFENLFYKISEFNYGGINYEATTEHKIRHKGHFICPKYLAVERHNPTKLKENLNILFPVSDLEASFDGVIYGYPIKMERGYCLPGDVRLDLMADNLKRAYQSMASKFKGEHTPTAIKNGRIYGEPFAYNKTVYQYCTTVKFMDAINKVEEAKNKYDHYEEIIEAYNEMFANKIKPNPKISLLREIEKLNLQIAELDKSN